MKKLAIALLAICLSLIVLAAPAPNTGTVTLSWGYDFSSNPNVTNFMVYHGTASGTYTDSFLAGGTNTTATVTGLARGQTHYFTVTPVNFGIEGDYGNEVSAVIHPKPGVTTNVTVIITIQ